MIRILFPFLLIYYFYKKFQEIRLKRYEENVREGVQESDNNANFPAAGTMNDHATRIPMHPKDIDPPPPYTEREEK